MAELFLFSLPTFLYLFVHRNNLNLARTSVGIIAPKNSDFLWAAITGILLCALAYPVTQSLPDALRGQAGVTVAALSIWSVSQTIFRAAGEEIFFRGFLQGVLEKRLSAVINTIVVATLFLLPHLLLLQVDIGFWKLLPLQWVGGIVFGALRYKTGGITAPVLAHSAVNLAQIMLI
ncbi:CPBP family intramembrane glutamic endopeptidase [Corynebacterium freiburgense]|uniref:CPBP family intramembrane glutamic endopeptidase n=1 Tax=Corynebacterium freiburgense TaxID=556548 RepID=UPI000429B176|nr:CPBP family intramembrane glutamic endopeptidase [Corynebacterium freiburgense]WJZ02938.1 CAAX amino terminal protease self- immunity [Corynebacterium freiburgense]